MRLRSIKHLPAFEACEGCPLTEKLEDAGTSVGQQVNLMVGSMKKVPPGLIVQNIEPPTAALERIKDIIVDDDRMAEFVATSWSCVRKKQNHICDNHSVVSIQPEDRHL